jgi:hypothetical protein
MYGGESGGDKRQVAIHISFRSALAIYFCNRISDILILLGTLSIGSNSLADHFRSQVFHYLLPISHSTAVHAAEMDRGCRTHR